MSNLLIWEAVWRSFVCSAISAPRNRTINQLSAVSENSPGQQGLPRSHPDVLRRLTYACLHDGVQGAVVPCLVF